MRPLPLLSGMVLLTYATASFAQVPKQEQPESRQPRAAVPGPNAVPGIPDGEKSKTPDFSVDENMPHLSRDQVAAVGARLRNEAGDPVGTVENVVVDHDGRVVSLVIGIDKMLGLAEDRIEIDWEQVRIERKDSGATFVTSLSKDELRNRPKLDAPKRKPG